MELPMSWTFAEQTRMTETAGFPPETLYVTVIEVIADASATALVLSTRKLIRTHVWVGWAGADRDGGLKLHLGTEICQVAEAMTQTTGTGSISRGNCGVDPCIHKSPVRNVVLIGIHHRRTPRERLT